MRKSHLEELIRNIQAYVVLIDEDLNVLHTNFHDITSLKQLVTREKVGELFRCNNAINSEGGCGSTSQCHGCPVRVPIEEAFSTDVSITDREVELYVSSEDGEPQPVTLYMSARPLRMGARRCMVLTFYDITTMKDITAKLDRANKLAEAASKARAAFMANMSHDLRTPLNAIVGFSQMMHRTDDPKKKNLFLHQIETNKDILLNLINNILEMTQLDSGNFELVNQTVEISDLMQQMEKMMANKVKPSVILNCVLGAKHLYAVTDPTKVTQVMLNMLNNAEKFTQRGSITFGYEPSPDEIYFYVKDTGIGIDPSERDQIFGTLSKVDSIQQGSGMSLAISKRIIENMGGDIGFESRGRNKGATFWFTIPFQEADPSTVTETANPKLDDYFEEADSKPTVVEEEPQQQRHEHTIMIAEDNESNYLLFETLLEGRYNLVHAFNGQEAVDKYPSVKPDLILMDINMPLMDGYEATRLIREMDPKVPIIAVTAYAFIADKQRIYENGFNGYVSKPINVDRLERLINTHLAAANQ